MVTGKGAIHPRHQKRGTLETQTLLQIEVGLQDDLPGLLGVLALAAPERFNTASSTPVREMSMPRLLSFERTLGHSPRRCGVVAK